MLLPEILLSLRSFFTVVPLRAAISDSVSPFLMVTLLSPLFLLVFLPFLLRLLRTDFLLRLLFDDETLLLETVLGRLTVKGAGLHIVNFDTASGDLFAEGKIYAAVYTSDEKNGGFFSRVFR